VGLGLGFERTKAASKPSASFTPIRCASSARTSVRLGFGFGLEALTLTRTRTLTRTSSARTSVRRACSHQKACDRLAP
jgi:hypothetical protein